MNTFFGLYFYFCLKLALEIWAKASLEHSLEVHDLKKTDCTSRNGAPTWGRYSFYAFVLTSLEMIQPVPTKTIPPSAKAASHQIHSFFLNMPAHLLYPNFFANAKPIRLHQLITCTQIRQHQKASSVVKWLTQKLCKAETCEMSCA